MEIIYAPAKINLALDVLYRRSDGYHEVDMIMQSITLADELEFAPHDQIELTCDHPGLPVGEQNLVWQAVRLIQTELGINTGVKIAIHKKIPVAAGLAGGSSDAAATLIGLNRLWKLDLTQGQLIQLGVKLGADVPFCILQGTARARGIGEKLTKIASCLRSKLLLVTPNIGVATPDVYRQLKVDQIKQHPQVDRLITALHSGNGEQLYTMWGNVLETVVLPRYREVQQLKGIFTDCGLKACLMSGSGPSVFGLNPTAEQVSLVERFLPPEWFRCICEFV
jgi:4-diphosphocytidyl-2-C-methyl-D-erythritol kinase